MSADMLDGRWNEGEYEYIDERRTKGDLFYSCLVSIVSRDIEGNQYKGSHHPQTSNTP